MGESGHHPFHRSHAGPVTAAVWLDRRHAKFILPAPAVPVMKFMAFYLCPLLKKGKAAIGPQGYVSKPAGFSGPVSMAPQNTCHGIIRSVSPLQTVQQIEVSAALCQNGHPGTGCCSHRIPHGSVGCQGLPMVFRITSPQNQPVQSLRQFLLMERTKIYKLGSGLFHSP